MIAEEVEMSLQKTVEEIPAEINEFHVAPVVAPKEGLPHHEWLIEFKTMPNNLSDFEKKMDENLQKHNLYYKDLIAGKVLKQLKITVINKNGFRNYMKSIGKLGGQNKIPKISNNRKLADQLNKLNLVIHN